MKGFIYQRALSNNREITEWTNKNFKGTISMKQSIIKLTVITVSTLLYV